MGQALACALTLICLAACHSAIAANFGTPWGETLVPCGALIEGSTMIELPSTMFRRWTHSREEDTKDMTVFRPSSFAFPPSRGREGVEFRENGEFVHYRIGATDRSEAVVGQWRVEQNNVIDVDFPTAQLSPYRLIVISVGDDALRVRREAR
jgi:hypothetical protein